MIETEGFCSRVGWGSHALIILAAMLHDVGDVAESFDIIDSGGFTKQAGLCGVGWAQAYLAA